MVDRASVVRAKVSDKPLISCIFNIIVVIRDGMIRIDITLGIVMYCRGAFDLLYGDAPGLAGLFYVWWESTVSTSPCGAEVCVLRNAQRQRVN